MVVAPVAVQVVQLENGRFVGPPAGLARPDLTEQHGLGLSVIGEVTTGTVGFPPLVVEVTTAAGGRAVPLPVVASRHEQRTATQTGSGGLRVTARLRAFPRAVDPVVVGTNAAERRSATGAGERHAGQMDAFGHGGACASHEEG